MEVSLTDDKVDDLMRRIPIGEDVYVMMHGRILKRSEKLNSRGVSDGCTIQITSMLRGRGRHKDKRNKAQKKRDKDKDGQKDQQVDKCQEMTQSKKDVTIQMLKGNEGYREIIKMISETGDEEHGMQCFEVLLQKEV